MVHLVRPLSLQEIPYEVATGLRTLSEAMPRHLSTVLKNMPEGFVQAKLEPANSFAALLDRLLRTNEAAQQAGQILINNHEVDKMKNDWKRCVDQSKSIMLREVPCGRDEVIKILEQDVIELLLNEDYKKSKHGNNGNGSKSEAVIVRWADYLCSLPGRFPYVPTRLFLLCMNAVLTASLREISFRGGEGFGAWWIVKCWIDEWMGWTAEVGGFLNRNNHNEHQAQAGARAGVTAAAEQQEAEEEEDGQVESRIRSYISGMDGVIKLSFDHKQQQQQQELIGEYMT